MDDKPIIENFGMGSFMVGEAFNGEPIVTIKYDGTVEVNPKYTVDQAARAFWNAVIAISEDYKRKQRQ